ncbi:MAG: 16S rRNA (guanine(966)-N(2))-methyltransferase RsmD [Candidatus Omnitrophota bacterium]|nr:MAG: 16S rRNA (guanine(966)-N(2))-methyltransferase RsmD [Candidatus Omnitrophota bacterium]
MRIIAGKFKGRNLSVPKGVKLRGTSQKVKEALFCILGNQIRGASFLELFAGSGNVGIEAKSRGADKVFFVENNRACIKTIKENLKRLGIKETETVLLPLNAERALRVLNQRHEKFDFIFLDPPYYENQLKNSLIKITLYDILKPRAYVVAEHHKKEVLPHLFRGLSLIFTKTYGDTTLSFYQMEQNKEE